MHNAQFLNAWRDTLRQAFFSLTATSTATTLLRGTLIKRIKTNGSRTGGAPGAKHLTSFSLKEKNTTSFYYNKSKNIPTFAPW